MYLIPKEVIQRHPLPSSKVGVVTRNALVLAETTDHQVYKKGSTAHVCVPSSSPPNTHSHSIQTLSLTRTLITMYIPNVQSILAAGLALTGMPDLMKKRESLVSSCRRMSSWRGLPFLHPTSLYHLVFNPTEGRMDTSVSDEEGVRTGVGQPAGPALRWIGARCATTFPYSPYLPFLGSSTLPFLLPFCSSALPHTSHRPSPSHPHCQPIANYRYLPHTLCNPGTR